MDARMNQVNHVNQRPVTRRRRGAASTMVLVAVVGAVALLIGGWVVLSRGGSDLGAPGAELASVERGGFAITIPAAGELAAQAQREIASRLEGRNTITYVVNEGDQVSQGDVLVRFDDETIRDRIRDRKLAVDNAEARHIASQASLSIRKEASESEESLAGVDVKLARLAMQAWEEGDDVSRMQTLELDVNTAQKNYDRLVARFDASKQLLADEFISLDEYQRDEIEMIRAESQLEQARLSKQVYMDYTREKERERLEADVKRAEDRLSEITQRNLTELENLQRDVENKQFALETEREALEKAENQLEACTIIAPQDGLVVYASSLRTGRWGRDERNPPTVGTEVRRNETIIVLPDTTDMIAEVKVNEALSGKITPGQRAIVYSDALPDQAIEGDVIGVGVLAESGGWRDPNRRDYTVRIKLLDINGLELKPAMRCRAEIRVDDVDSALFVPVPAVFRNGPLTYVYVPDGSGFAAKRVAIGRSSELYIEVLEGLAESDRVLMSEPAPERITVRAEELMGEMGAPGNRRGPGGPPGGGPPARQARR